MESGMLGWIKRLTTSKNHDDGLLPNPNQKLEKKELSGELEKDLQQLKQIFDRLFDIVYREIPMGDSHKGMIILLDGFVNTKIVDENIIKPLLDYGKSMPPIDMDPNKGMENLLQQISVAQVKWGDTIQEVVDHVLWGDTVLLIDGMKKALFMSAKEWDKRSVEEPATEAVIRGPRDGFTENLQTNIILIRRRLKTPQLKMEKIHVGKLSKTEIVITYIDGIAESSLLTEVRKRLDRIDIDAILESGYIEEWIEDNPYSFFPQVQYTERPDKVVGNILEGKVGILIDNTPFALIVPVTFYEMMQSNEDYYQRYLMSTAIRWIRFLFVGVALLLPSLYIAILTYHQEMIPTALLFSAAASREPVPFPALVEALLMEISFEGLREAGVRLPRPVGTAVSIVGALVIGEAAVRAGLVSAPMVIIVSITGIASFTIPSFSQAQSIRLLRFPMMLIAGSLGLYGVLMGILLLLTHMARLRSFGVPFLSPVAPLHVSDLKDIFIRMPWWSMTERSDETAKENPQRMKSIIHHSPNSNKE